MRLVLDPDFDSGAWPGPLGGREASAGEEWVGPGRCCEVLETALGLAAPRLAQSERAARLVARLGAVEGFWSGSAQVDPFGVARRLLEWRDALAWGGWRGEGAQPRLAALAAVTRDSAPGLPDRLHAVNERLASRDPGIESVTLLVPREDLEQLLQGMLHRLEERGARVTVRRLEDAPPVEGTDLAAARGERFEPQGDGSLRLLRSGGPLAAAEEVAAWLASLAGGGDTLIIGGDPALDAALHRHGLPTIGAGHALRDGAPLQILPLVLELGWSPPDPQRAYELLSLVSSPVPSEVRWGLREALQRWPAVDSDEWREALARGLDSIEDATRRQRVRERLEVLWDARVARAGRFPAAEVARRAGMLRQWLVGRIATAGDGEAEWRSAAAQCDGLLGLVQRAGLGDLGAAQLRRLVREATDDVGSAGPFPAQAGIRAVGVPGGVAGPVGHAVWWGFDEGGAPGVARLPLTREERGELESLGVLLPDPGRVAAARARRWRRPLGQATRALLLVCPEHDARGEELHPHPLWDDLVSRVSLANTRRVAEHALLRRTLAGAVPQSPRALLPLAGPRRDWPVPPGVIVRREKESPSSVETLLGCPFRWVLQYPARVRVADSAQVADGTDARLLGDLLHAVLNRLFAGPARTRAAAEREAGELFDREGPRLAAALFLPGADSQRERVRRTAVRTAGALYALMEAQGIRVTATEAVRSGSALGGAFEGRVDLVLGDPPRILDLKWGGAGWRRDALAAGTALQLASYAFLERGKQDGPFPPVGYFVMEAQRLLTTEPDAFHGAEQVDGPGPAETWRILEGTHALEWERVRAGRLEARGVVEQEGQDPPQDARIVDGRITLPPPCSWCDFTALCGRAFLEQEEA